MLSFSVSRTALSEALSVVTRAVSGRTALTALEGVHIAALPSGHITLSGYDLELGISTKIEARVDTPGQMVIGARVFHDIVRRMPEELIKVHVDDKFMTELRSGLSAFSILALSAEDFPDFPAAADAERFTLSEPLFKDMISQTLYAAAVSDSKPVHTGSLFDIKGGMLNLVSVDGYRLALRREKIDCERDIRFIVPAKALGELSRILGEDEEQNVEIELSRRHIVFHTGEYKIVSRLIEGEFLDYNAAIPQGFTTEVKVNVRAFADCIERASLLISDRIRSPLRVTFENGDIRINCQTALGRAYDEMKAEQTGENLEIGFNNRYLLDALRNSGCDSLRLEISGPLSPMKLKPIDGDEFTFLVLPVRLQRGEE